MPGEVGNAVLAGALECLLELRLVQEIRIPNPAAGADWIQRIPGGVVWEVLSVESLFTASAAVANRSPMLQIINADGQFVARFPAPAVVTAGTGARVLWATGLGAVGSVGTQSALLSDPPPVMLSGMSIGSLTGLLDAADQYSAIVMMVRQWSEDDILREWQELMGQINSLTYPQITGREQ